MTADREIAQAISDGTNCIHAVLKRLDSGPQALPEPAWPNALGDLERALERVIAHEVVTSMRVTQADLDRIRDIKHLVSAWITAHQAPEGLRAQAEEALQAVGLSEPMGVEHTSTKNTPR